MRDVRGLVAVTAFGAAVVLGGCAGSPPSQSAAPDEPETARLRPGAVWVAEAVSSQVTTYEDRDGTPSQTMRNPDAIGTPLTFLVDGGDVDGEWVEVHLPVRPNGARAWVRRQDVRFSQNPYAIEIDLGDRQLTITNGDEVALRSPIAVGKQATPTPEGRFFVKELIQPDSPDTVYGAYAFGLSAFSEVVASAQDETVGAIAIHGTNDPESIGEAVSNGCIRLPNEAVTQMADFIPLGTPVEIKT